MSASATILEKASDHARKAIYYAQEEARSVEDKFVSPEHLLLGILTEPDTTASQVLAQLGFDREQVEAEIRPQLNRGDAGPDFDDFTLSPRAKRLTEISVEEARSLGHEHIGTEHFLLAIIRQNDGLAGEVLTAHAVDIESARLKVGELRPPSAAVWPPPPLGTNPPPASTRADIAKEQMIRSALKDARIALAIAAGFILITVALLIDQLISKQKPFFGSIWAPNLATSWEPALLGAGALQRALRANRLNRGHDTGLAEIITSIVFIAASVLGVAYFIITL